MAERVDKRKVEKMLNSPEELVRQLGEEIERLPDEKKRKILEGVLELLNLNNLNKSNSDSDKEEKEN